MPTPMVDGVEGRVDEAETGGVDGVEKVEDGGVELGREVEKGGGGGGGALGVFQSILVVVLVAVLVEVVVVVGRERCVLVGFLVGGGVGAAGRRLGERFVGGGGW